MALLNGLLMISLNLIIVSVSGYIVNPGPLVIATKGEPWPKPQNQTKSNGYFIVRPHLFSFQTTSEVCQTFLQSAFSRYANIISRSTSVTKRGRFWDSKNQRYNKKFWLADENFIAYLDTLNVELTGSCENDEYPTLNSSESYQISITETDNLLTASSIWGVLRGLETFSQLTYLQDDALLLNSTIIDDFPRFHHRGLLLDTSRHFLPVYSILETLDAMAYNKLNIFHWHIVDDQSFPYKSLIYPELSNQGAYHPVSKVYEQSDIQKIIEYARVRGIRVIPEFDTPGHTRSWGVAYPELLTECYNNDEKSGQLGPMNPILENTYSFIDNLFKEVVEVFPDTYIHLGGDEVDFDCWESNPEIAQFMSANNITNYTEVESYFIQKLLSIVDNLNVNYVVWEEVFDNGITLPNSTLVHVWKTGDLETLSKVTKAGKFALYSSCWYLDHLATGGDWAKFYDCDPYNMEGTEEDKQRIIGGEACMWGEVVNEHNLTPRVWPRASAVAEKLWSAYNAANSTESRERLEEHTCRMNHRGIAAQPPNAAGVCL